MPFAQLYRSAPHLAEGFIPHWAAQPEGEDQSSADKMNNTRKVVISSTARALHAMNFTLNLTDIAGLDSYVADHAERVRAWMRRPAGL